MSFRRTLTDFAGFLDLLGREFHFICQCLTDGNEPTGFKRILLDPFLEVICVDEEALMKTAGRGPCTIRALPLAEPRHGGLRFERGYFTLESLDNNFLP